MRFKATLAVLLALSLFLTACGTAKTPPETTAEPTVSQETTQATEETLAPLYTRPAEDEQESVDSDEPAIEGDQDGDTDGDQSDSDDSVGSAGGADSGDTFADGGVTSAVKGNAVKLTWSAIRSYPIKSSTMSVS